MERCVKLDWDIDLSKYADALINRPSETGPKSNPIERELLLEIVPEIKELDDVLATKGIGIAFSSVMSIEAGTFGVLHVDWKQDNQIHDFKLNIPIVNGSKMKTRWYNLTGLPYDTVDWAFDRSNLCAGDLWFLSHQELLVEHHCVETLELDGPYLFNSGIPHNVDGRHSLDTRSILGMNIVDIEHERFLTWNERQLVIDSVNELKQIHPK
jgi:hypothetical protein